MRTLPRRQRGITLLVGLIFLVLLTLMGVAAFNFGKAGFMATANMQFRNESTHAAEQVIDELIDNTNIELTNATNLYGTGSNVRQIDINGQGTRVTVTVAPPTCIQTVVIKNTALDLTKDDDLGCSRGVDQGSLGVEGATAGDSLCSETVWEVRATAEQSLSGAKATVVQGVGQRVATGLVANACNS